MENVWINLLNLATFLDQLKILLNRKQDKLRAGTNITIKGNKISALNYTAGEGIDITNNVISNTQPQFSGSYNDLNDAPEVTIAQVLKVLNDEEESE